jgi:hypothetical protein
MYGQPNYYYQQPQQQIRGIDFMQPQYQNIGLKGRPVSSIEEVRAAQIDFDGSLFVFPDIANKCIYTKQISATGAAVLNKYNLQEDTQPTFPTYVTKEEFDTIINQLKNAIDNKDALITQLATQQVQINQQQQQFSNAIVEQPKNEPINF